MKSTLVLATTAFLLATGGLLAGGCQLIAGVHTDGELLGGGAGGTGTTSTAGGTGGGTGGGGPCQSPADCPGQVCLAGACVSPKCVPSGDPAVLFSSADVGGHNIDGQRIRLVADGDRIHIIIADQDQPRLLARTWSNDPANPGSSIVELDLAANGGSSFDLVRLDAGNVHLSGRWGEQIGEVDFSVSGQTIQPGPMFVPYPAPPASCVQPNGSMNNVSFDHVGGATRYALECQGATTRSLLVGSDTVAPEVVVEGDIADMTLHLRGYLDRADGVQLLLAGGGDTDPTLYRAGADAAALQETHEIKLDPDPNVLNFLANPIHTPSGDALFIGATVSSITSKGSLWGGIVTDYASLTSVPPTGVAPILAFDAPPFSNLSDLQAHPSGYYAVGPTMDGTALNVLWLDPTATTLLVAFTPVISLPAGDTGKIINASVVRATLNVAAAYTVLRDGAVSVEGTRFVCSY